MGSMQWQSSSKCVIIIIIIITLIGICYRVPKISSMHQTITDINEWQQNIQSGIDFIKVSGDTTCNDESYMNKLSDLSKASFITLLSDSWNLNYLRGALVWTYKINQLHQSPSIPITIALDPHTLSDLGGEHIIKAFKVLGATNILIINQSFHNDNAKRKSWQNIYTKLRLFDPQLFDSSELDFAQIAYFDADCLPLQPMYELFSIPCTYLLGAANDVRNHLNAGFLVIRPIDIIYKALHSLFEIEIGHKHTDMSEQTMIDTLFFFIGNKQIDEQNPKRPKSPSDTYYYRFPYEYNSPWWQNNYKRPGGYKGMKNIHNRMWNYNKPLADYQLLWQQTWNKVWEILTKNEVTKNILDLNKCDALARDVCAKDDIK